MGFHLYALGQKDWVLVRKARKSPVAVTTVRKHTLTLSEQDRQYWLSQHYVHPPKTITLKQITFKGGRFVGSLPKRAFHALTRLSLKLGEVKEIPPTFHSNLMERFQHG